jgi:hypothetical protein
MRPKIRKPKTVRKSKLSTAVLHILEYGLKQIEHEKPFIVLNMPNSTTYRRSRPAGKYTP